MVKRINFPLRKNYGIKDQIYILITINYLSKYMSGIFHNTFGNIRRENHILSVIFLIS